jgi:hypothetical protein
MCLPVGFLEQDCHEQLRFQIEQGQALMRIVPCTDCGQSDPDKRCAGCWHKFERPEQAEHIDFDSDEPLQGGNSCDPTEGVCESCQ